MSTNFWGSSHLFQQITTTHASKSMISQADTHNCSYCSYSNSSLNENCYSYWCIPFRVQLLEGFWLGLLASMKCCKFRSSASFPMHYPAWWEQLLVYWASLVSIKYNHVSMMTASWTAVSLTYYFDVIYIMQPLSLFSLSQRSGARQGKLQIMMIVTMITVNCQEQIEEVVGWEWGLLKVGTLAKLF